MKKIIAQKNAFCLPWTQTILGTHLKGKVNFMALDWCTRVNFTPPMLGVCVNYASGSHEAIVETNQFSVNVPSVELMEVTDYTGLVSGKRVDKSNLFEVFYGELPAAPMIRACPLTMECRVNQQVDLPSNTFFIGDIVNIYSEDQYLTNDQPDAAKIRPFLLIMPDNRYWALGQHIGRAWEVGKSLRKQQG